MLPLQTCSKYLWQTECLNFSSYPKIFSGYTSHLSTTQLVWFLEDWMWEPLRQMNLRPELSKLNVPSSENVQKSNNLTDKPYLNELKYPSKLVLTLHSDSNVFDNLFDLTNWFYKSIRLLAFIFSFIRNSKGLYNHTGSHFLLMSIQRAYFCLVRHIQVEVYTFLRFSLWKGDLQFIFLIQVSSKFLISISGLFSVGSGPDHTFTHEYSIVLSAGKKLIKCIFQYNHIIFMWDHRHH